MQETGKVGKTHSSRYWGGDQGKVKGWGGWLNFSTTLCWSWICSGRRRPRKCCCSWCFLFCASWGRGLNSLSVKASWYTVSRNQSRLLLKGGLKSVSYKLLGRQSKVTTEPKWYLTSFADCALYGRPGRSWPLAWRGQSRTSEKKSIMPIAQKHAARLEEHSFKEFLK